MELKTEQEGGLLIITPAGRIDGSNAFEFQTAIDSALANHNAAVIMDLSELTYISSAGLRVILLLAKKLRGQSSNLALCSLASSILDVFEISGFGKIIPIHDTKADAVSALSAA